MTDLVQRLRRGSQCVYIAVAKDTADDLADMMLKAADEIERLEQYYDAEYKIVDRVWKVLGIKTFEDAKGKEISEIVQDKLDEIERLRDALEEISMQNDPMSMTWENTVKAYRFMKKRAEDCKDRNID